MLVPSAVCEECVGLFWRSVVNDQTICKVIPVAVDAKSDKKFGYSQIEKNGWIPDLSLPKCDASLSLISQ